MAELEERYGNKQRLRERFERTGFDGFAEHEIIELVLTLCIPRKDVKPVAQALLQRFGSLRGVLDASKQKLCEVDGVGALTPVALRIIKETSSAYLQQEVEQEKYNQPSKLKQLWTSRFSGLKMEVFEIACLDNGLRLLPDGIERVAEGTFDRSIVYPRSVLSAALRHEASAIVLAHNHPGGTLRPSKQDIDLTRSIIVASQPFNIRVCDHMIVADRQVFSFYENKLMK